MSLAGRVRNIGCVAVATSTLAASAILAASLTPAGATPRPGAPTAAQVRAGEWWLGELGIQKAWSVTRGKGVTVGLLDSGVDATHPDLHDALVPGSDVSGEGAANGERPVEGVDHGTTMAGYIAGRGHGGVGMIGVAPQAEVMSVSTSDKPSDAKRYGAGLRYLVDHGAKVVNMSFVNDVSPDAADIAYAESHDVVLVAGTGNDGGHSGPEAPSSLFGVVSVSGVYKNLTIAPQANYGPPQIDKGVTTTTGMSQGTALAGPFASTSAGQDMVGATTVADGSYMLGDGTSNATAIVSGIAALIRAAHPDMNAANVINLLISTASLLKNGEVSPKIGFGVPNAYAAVSSTSIKSVCENPLGSEATKSLGFWPSVLDSKVVYKQKCDPAGSSSAPPSSTSSSSGSTSTSSSGGAGPASSGPPAQASGGGSSGVPAWVWIVIAVAVLAAIGLLLALRSRGKRGGPGGPPAGGGYGPSGPPGGGYGSPPSGPYNGPPQGGWQQGPPPQGGWRPGGPG